jgi:hypothetical protein
MVLVESCVDFLGVDVLLFNPLLTRKNIYRTEGTYVVLCSLLLRISLLTCGGIILCCVLCMGPHLPVVLLLMSYSVQEGMHKTKKKCELPDQWKEPIVLLPIYKKGR